MVQVNLPDTDFHGKIITGYEFQVYMMQKISFIAIFLALFLLVFLFPAGVGEDISAISDPLPNQVTYEKTTGFFDIRIVSPDMFETVLVTLGKKAIPLKVERGIYIGVLAPGILYLRGDLNEEVFPVREIVHDNTDEKVARHLIDIIFGRDNSKTELFDQTKDYLVWLDAMYLPEDVQILHEIIDALNDLSQTIRFEDDEIALPSYKPNYNPIPYLYYKISIVDKDLFQEKLDERNSATEQILKDNMGQSVALVCKDHLYLLNDLAGKERRHFLIKGLLFSMGFHGESTIPDSFFHNENIKTNLSLLDKKAIELMYGGRLQSGLDIDAVKKSLGLGTKD